MSKRPRPLISVIIPVYQTKATLERCINSLLTQNYHNFELILVDDGSTDGAGKLCDQLAKTDTRIIVIHQKNAGLSAARNTGLKLAQGEYLTFIDSDDAYQHQNYLAQLYQPIADSIASGASRVKLSITSFAEVFPNGKQKRFVDAMPGTVIMDAEQCLSNMLGENGYTMSAWGKLYHRSLFDQVKFPEGKLYEDVGTTYRLVMQCEPGEIAFQPLTGYLYYQNASSIIHQDFNFQKLDLIALTDQMCAAINTKLPSLSDVTRLRRAHARFSILRQMVMSPVAVKREKRFKQVQAEIITYLHQHKQDVLKNPQSKRRDRLAMCTLLLGLPVFTLAWKVYSRLRS